MVGGMPSHVKLTMDRCAVMQKIHRVLHCLAGGVSLIKGIKAEPLRSCNSTKELILVCNLALTEIIIGRNYPNIHLVFSSWDEYLVKDSDQLTK